MKSKDEILSNHGLVVHEIYASIQGESSFMGIPCTFIRLTGCNLRCSWCDTPQAFHQGTRKSLDAIVKESLSLDTPLVEVTGGEPLLQSSTPLLLEKLCDADKTVLIETSGERDISIVDPRVHRIMDLKAPGSGESERNLWSNIEHLTPKDEVKIVLSDRADYVWAKNVIEEHQLSDKVNCVLLSCVWGKLEPQELVQWILQDKLPVRFQLQSHKFIWGPETPGV